MLFRLLLITFLILPNIGASQINIDSITQNNAFKPGEKLIYSVKYGLIKGGEASMSINIIPSGDTYYYHARAVAQTTGLAAGVATIYDVYESYMSITSGYPFKAIRNVTEATYVRYNELLFYRDSNYVVSLNKGKKWIPRNCHDIISAFYYARRNLFDKKFQKGDEIDLTTILDNKILPIKIKYKENEYVRTKFGRVMCLKFVPVLDKHNPFKKEDDLEIWFSDDGNYIPIKIKMDAPIGSVKAVLIDYENLKNPLGIK